MGRTDNSRIKQSWRRSGWVADPVLLTLMIAVVLVVAAGPVIAQQSWWPFGGEPERAPVPREPVYRAPPPPPAAPGQAWGGNGGNGSRSAICLQLEQRLVQEGQRGSESRTLVPMVENELKQLQVQNRAAEQQLERGNCYEYFLFSKTLRRTRKCVDLANEVDETRGRMADLETQLRQLTASSGRSYQEDIIRELARNNCGATYEQQARRRSDGGGNFWDEGESVGPGSGFGTYGNLGYATYRTVCVRLCDGYYFPVSFSTLPNHFERDAEVCASKCAAPAELYYHQNPGAGMDQAVSAMTNAPYTQLKTAFRYRKEYVQGCSCKMAEYVPEPGAAPTQQQQGAAPGAPGTTPAQRATPSMASGAPAASGQPAAPDAGAELPWSLPR